MKKGFTLIELLAVIVVLAIISVIAVPTLIGVVNKAKLNTLKSSAYGLIEAGTLYHAQYDNRVNARFDISNNDITTNEASKIKYKGYIKQGVVIVSTKGKVSVCVTDGKNSAYKNYDDSEVTLVSGKTCTVPANTSIVYLDGEATISVADAKAVLDTIDEIEAKLNSTPGGMRVLKYGVITATTTVQLDEEINPSNYIVNITTSAYQTNSGFIDTRSCPTGCTWGYALGYGDGAYISDKTSNSVTINVSSGITAAYEIVKVG